MERKEFREQLFAIATQLGCDAAETYYEGSDSFSASVLNGALEKYQAAKEGGLNLRVNFEGKDGYAYTESFDDPETLVRRAIDNARVIESTDVHPMLGAQTYETVAARKTPLDDVTIPEKIEMALKMERDALAFDPRIRRIQESEVMTGHSVIELHNTLGLAAERTSNESALFLAAIAEENGTVKDGFAARLNEAACDMDGAVKEACEDAIFKLNAEPVATGTYRVLFKNSAAATFLSPFLGIFSAEEAQKGRSLLAGREGETIAAPCFTLWDDPFHPYAPRAFDGEGFPTRKKAIIENGVFCTLLHNTKTALKAGTVSTGNATRSGASPVGVGPTVLSVGKGEGTYEQMLEKLGNGLMIDDFGGLHVGMNPISGDFSIMASGALIENGKPVRAVDRITIAGNLYTLLKDIEAVGADAKFTLYGAIESPSILIGSLSVAGK